MFQRVENGMAVKKKVFKPFKVEALKDLEAFRQVTRELGYDFPTSASMEALKQPLLLEGKVIPNRIGINPCEGFDANPDGTPGPLTIRRYNRFGDGGCGLIWFEAMGVSEQGKGNVRQVMLTEERHIAPLREMLDSLLAHARNARGAGFRPYLAIQLTHAGRCSYDENMKFVEKSVVFNPYTDLGKEDEIHYLTDGEIEQAEDDFAHAAYIAMQAGFDAVDIKICHHYLLRELLSAVTRPGKYGGSFENRSRAIFNIIDKIRALCGGGIAICARMNAYDCWRWPYGWGMATDGSMRPDLTEPIQLARMLVDRGVKLINISTHLPRYSPYGKGELAEYDDETPIDPYFGVHNLLKATRQIKEAVPDAVIMSTGLSWFSQFGANVGAGGVEQGWFDIAGYGRQSFAYPDFANDILDKGGFQVNKCCVMCDKCFDLISNGERGGCVVRDSKVYVPHYTKMMENIRKKRGEKA